MNPFSLTNILNQARAMPGFLDLLLRGTPIPGTDRRQVAGQEVSPFLGGPAFEGRGENLPEEISRLAAMGLTSASTIPKAAGERVGLLESMVLGQPAVAGAGGTCADCPGVPCDTNPCCHCGCASCGAKAKNFSEGCCPGFEEVAGGWCWRSECDPEPPPPEPPPPEPEPETHKICFNKKCVETLGAGEDTCMSDGDCEEEPPPEEPPEPKPPPPDPGPEPEERTFHITLNYLDSKDPYGVNYRTTVSDVPPGYENMIKQIARLISNEDIERLGTKIGPRQWRLYVKY